MNFKKISIIIASLSFNLKGIAIPINEKETTTGTIDIYSDIEISEDEIVQLTVDGNDYEVTEAISELENDNSFEIDSTVEESDDEECLTQECFETSKRILKNLDVTVDPCDDFYQFTCGGWINETISENYMSSVLMAIGEKINSNVISIIKSDYQTKKNLSEKEQEYDKIVFDKVQNLYNSCLRKDEQNESNRMEQLLNYLKELNFAEEKNESEETTKLTNLFVKLHNNGFNFLFKVEPYHDEKYSNTYIPRIKENYTLMQVLLGVSEILKNSNPNLLEGVVFLYKSYLSYVLREIYNEEEEKNIESLIETIVEMDKSIGLLYMQKPKDSENEINIKILNEVSTGIDWNSYFDKRNEFYKLKNSITNDTLIYSDSLDLLKNIYSSFNADSFIDYAEWFVIDTFLSEVSYSLSNIKYNIMKMMFAQLIEEYNTIDNIEIKGKLDEFLNYYYNEDNLYGSMELMEDDGVNIGCLQKISTIMPYAISKLYVENVNFDKEIEETQVMNSLIKEAMVNRLSKIEWLDDPTRDYAMKKVLSMSSKIGYPDYVLENETVYRLYEKLDVRSDDYFRNIIQSYKFKNMEAYQKFDDEKYLESWQLVSSDVNAYYETKDNSMNFPIGIMQPPTLDVHQPDYLNYGSLGAIIGHELTHAFDNKGKLYDVKGKLKDWWTENDKEEFQDYSNCFLDQYSRFASSVGDDSSNSNAFIKLGEILADNGGLARSYEAWKMTFDKDPEKAQKRNKKLPGLSDYTIEQLFYIAFGQTFCDVGMEAIYQTDSHPIGKFRINGTVQNSKEFSRVFHCASNSPMNPPDKCSIW